MRSRPTCARPAGLSGLSPLTWSSRMWGLLLAHYAIRELMCRAADQAGHDPDRVSFIPRRPHSLPPD